MADGEVTLEEGLKYINEKAEEYGWTDEQRGEALVRYGVSYLLTKEGRM